VAISCGALRGRSSSRSVPPAIGERYLDVPRRILIGALRGGRFQPISAGWLIPLLVAAVALALPATGEAAGPGAITGTVSGEGAGVLAGVEVCAENVEAFEEEFKLECAETGIDGTYSITGLAVGEYLVSFWPPSGSNYVEQFYDGQSSWEEATPVQVAAGETKPGIDARLEKGATISGFVKAAATGLSVPGVLVCAFSTDGPGSGCAETNDVGGYTILGLSSGLYEVEFHPLETGQDVVSQQYAGGLVFVPAGGEVTGINEALPPGGQISGTVRAAATGTPLAGVEVCITEAEETWSLGCLKTPASGGYRFTGVWSGSFKIVFSPEASELENGEPSKITADPYPTQWWNGQPTFAAATPIGVTAPAVVTGIDGSLGPGPVVSASAPAPPAPVTAVVKPKPKPLKCGHGKVKAKRKVKGKQIRVCMKRHKPKKHHGKHHPKPRKHAKQSR
jgi:hypothetical protein